MLAKDVMTTTVITVRPKTEVEEIARILLERGISAVPVENASGDLVGIVSESDLMRRAESGTEDAGSWWLQAIVSSSDLSRAYIKTHGRHAKDVMTRNVISTGPGTSLSEIATLLEKNGIKRVPIVEDSKLVGIVSRANLLHGLVANGTPPVGTDDAALKQSILEELRKAGIRDLYLNVVVSDGRVQIWGTVETLEERQALSVAMENAAGDVEWVDNIRIVQSMVVRSLWA